MSWSAEQRRLLSGLGYALYRHLPANAAQAVAQAGSAAVSGDDSPLWHALCRAAGGRGLDGVVLPPLDRLRASASEKRALWPRLRALRRP